MAEAFPQSASPAPNSTTIKVSLDEWAVADRSTRTELMTDGLSGCVAIALKSDSRVGLTHVYSGALDHFADYREPLQAFARQVANGGQITEAYLVDNGNVRAHGQQQTLLEMIRPCLNDSGVIRPGAFVALTDNGCTLAEHGFFLKGRDNPAVYAPGGHTNTALQHVDAPVTATMAGHLVSGALYRSPDPDVPGYRGACELPDRPVALQPHRDEARIAPPQPPRELAAPADLETALAREIRDLKMFGFSQVRPVARTIADTLREHEMPAATLTASPDKTRLTATAPDGRTVPFDVVDGKVVAATGPASAALPEPRAVASSSQPFGPSVPVVTPVAPSLPSSLSAQPSSSMAAPPVTLYDQALAALQPHRETLRLQDPTHASNAAGLIASQARHDGLDAITRLELVGQERGAASLVAHQDGPSPKEATPMPVETLQRQVGATPSVPSQSGPDRPYSPTL